MHQLSGFEIAAISKNGRGSINYQIEDYEDGKIKLYCKDVIIEQVEYPAIIDFE